MRDKILLGIIAAIVIVVAMGAVATLVMQDSDTGNVLEVEVPELVVVEETEPATEIETDINLTLSNLCLESYREYWDFFRNDTEKSLICEITLKNIGDEPVVCYPAVWYKDDDNDTGWSYVSRMSLVPGQTTTSHIPIRTNSSDKLFNMTGGIVDSANHIFYEVTKKY